jgi:hypothetical protein
MVVEDATNKAGELLDGQFFEGGCSTYIQQHEVDVVCIIGMLMLLACPSAVNIDRHQGTDASVVACHHGGGRTMTDMIEAERSDGEQMGGAAS